MLREEKLAANLKALLRRWVEGDQTGFRVSLPCLLVLVHTSVVMYAIAVWLPSCAISNALVFVLSNQAFVARLTVKGRLQCHCLGKQLLSEQLHPCVMLCMPNTMFTT